MRVIDRINECWGWVNDNLRTMARWTFWIFSLGIIIALLLTEPAITPKVAELDVRAYPCPYDPTLTFFAVRIDNSTVIFRSDCP